MKYNRCIDALEQNAVLWWPKHLIENNANVNVLPKLLKSQDEFLKILSLSKMSPKQVFDIIKVVGFPANLFLKHLCVLADYGGEPIQRLGNSFLNIFPRVNGESIMTFFWEGKKQNYIFKSLPLKGLGNKKLAIDGEGLASDKLEMTNLYIDMIMLLMHGSTCEASEHAGLSSCEIGTLLGKSTVLKQYVKQRYIVVSRITGGGIANSLGQFAQQEVVSFLKYTLGDSFVITSNGTISLTGYNKEYRMPFDIVVAKKSKMIGIEISFQVTTNSTIERKSGQAADRKRLMNDNGNHVAYIIDGAGNFQRRSAISTLCDNSECTVAYSQSEFKLLAAWINSKYV